MANTGSHGCVGELLRGKLAAALTPPATACHWLTNVAGILSGIGYGFDSLGDRIHSLFPPALAVNILGHVNIRVTHVVPHNLRPSAFAQNG
jgi:hypothetical protein